MVITNCAVRKPDGSVRLCVNFRKLNSKTTPDPYQIPLIGDLIQDLGDAQYLTKLDLNKGFYQVAMAPDDMDKTAFVALLGSLNSAGCLLASVMPQPHSRGI